LRIAHGTREYQPLRARRAGGGRLLGVARLRRQ